MKRIAAIILLTWATIALGGDAVIWQGTQAKCLPTNGLLCNGLDRSGAGNMSIGTSVGANTLTLGGAPSVVDVPGSLTLGTPLAILEGGTSATTATGAATALGLGTSSTVSFSRLGIGTTSPQQGIELVGSMLVNGVSGAGFVSFGHQSSHPATPGSGSKNVRVSAQDGKLYTTIDNGSGTAITQEVGSGAAGGGETNYCTNPSAASSTTGWTASAPTHLALSRTTTAAELPRENTTATALKILGTANDETNDTVSWDFTVDDVDLSTQQKLKFDVKVIGSYTTGDLYATIISDPAGTPITRSTTAVAAADGQFYVEWNPNGVAATRFQFRGSKDFTDGAGIAVSNVSIGPDRLVQGLAGTPCSPLVGPVLKYATTAATNITSQTFSSCRTADRATIFGRVVFNGAANAVGAILLQLPATLTVDTSKLAHAQQESIGKASFYTNSKSYGGRVFVNSSTTFGFFPASAAGSTSGANWYGSTTAGDNLPSAAAIAASNYIDFTVENVPIVGWDAGVYMTQGRGFVGASAYKTTAVQSFTIGGAGTAQVKLDSVTPSRKSGFNIGGGTYNTTDGTFTVPAGAGGKYAVNAAMYLTSTDNVFYEAFAAYGASWATIGTAIYGPYLNGNAGGITPTVSGVLNLSAGDTVWLGLYVSGATTFDLQNGAENSYWQITRLTDENNQPIAGFKLASETDVGLVSKEAIGTLASTFTFNGTGSPGTSGTVALALNRVGNLAAISSPSAILATSGTNSSAMTSSATLPAYMIPTTARTCWVPGKNGTSLASPAVFNVGSNGVMSVYRDNAATTFSNATANCGVETSFSCVYSVQ